MTYVTAEARQQLLDDIAVAIEELGAGARGARRRLRAARRAHRRPARGGAVPRVQTRSAGRSGRDVAFAERYGLPGRKFAQPSAGLPSQGVTGVPRARRRVRLRGRRARSPSCRTRCGRSRSATRSCAPAWPRCANSSVTCRALARVHAHVRSLTHSSSGPRNEMFGWNVSVWPGTSPSARPAVGQLLRARAAPRAGRGWRRGRSGCPCRRRGGGARSAARRSNVSGSSKTSGSRPRPTIHRKSFAPAGSSTPPSVTSPRRHPPPARHRRVVAQRLLDGAGDQRRVGDEAVPARAVLEQSPHRCCRSGCSSSRGRRTTARTGSRRSPRGSARRGPRRGSRAARS